MTTQAVSDEQVRAVTDAPVSTANESLRAANAAIENAYRLVAGRIRSLNSPAGQSDTEPPAVPPAAETPAPPAPKPETQTAPTPPLTPDHERAVVARITDRLIGFVGLVVHGGAGDTAPVLAITLREGREKLRKMKADALTIK